MMMSRRGDPIGLRVRLRGMRRMLLDGGMQKIWLSIGASGRGRIEGGQGACRQDAWFQENWLNGQLQLPFGYDREFTALAPRSGRCADIDPLRWGVRARSKYKAANQGNFRASYDTEQKTKTVT